MPTNIKVFLASILSKIIIFFTGKIKFKKINNINFKLDLSEGIDLRLFLNLLEEKDLYFSLTKILSPYKKCTLIDIGANIGSVSLNLAKIFKKSNILSIEPTFYAFEKLKINISLNKKLKKRIKVSNLFVSNKKKLDKFTYSSWKLDFNKNSHPIHRGVLKRNSNNQKSLDNIIKKAKKVNFIKIDTDGNEFHILLSGKSQIKKYKPIIHMELAPYLFRENGFSIKQLINFVMKDLKYKFYTEKLEVIENIDHYIKNIGNSSKNTFLISSKFDFNKNSR